MIEACRQHGPHTEVQHKPGTLCPLCDAVLALELIAGTLVPEAGWVCPKCGEGWDGGARHVDSCREEIARRVLERLQTSAQVAHG